MAQTTRDSKYAASEKGQAARARAQANRQAKRTEAQAMAKRARENRNAGKAIVGTHEKMVDQVIFLKAPKLDPGATDPRCSEERAQDGIRELMASLGSRVVEVTSEDGTKQKRAVPYGLSARALEIAGVTKDKDSDERLKPFTTTMSKQ